MNGINPVTIGYNKFSSTYSDEKLEIFTKSKNARFLFLKLLQPIEKHGILMLDELSNQTYQLIDKSLYLTSQQNTSQYYLISHIIEFDEFSMTTGASVPVNTNTEGGKIIYDRFLQYLELNSLSSPTTAQSAQYVTDMYKIAIHEEIVASVPSKPVPFGKKALKERLIGTPYSTGNQTVN